MIYNLLTRSDDTFSLCTCEIISYLGMFISFLQFKGNLNSYVALAHAEKGHCIFCLKKKKKSLV